MRVAAGNRVVDAEEMVGMTAALSVAPAWPGRSWSNTGNTGISAGYGAFPQSFQADTPIVLDSASPLYTYLNGHGALPRTSRAPTT